MASSKLVEGSTDRKGVVGISFAKASADKLRQDY